MRYIQSLFKSYYSFVWLYDFEIVGQKSYGHNTEKEAVEWREKHKTLRCVFLKG